MNIMGKVVGAYLMSHPPAIIPEIGKGQEKQIEETTKSMEKIAKDIAQKEPETILIISPHGALFRDAVSIMGIPILKGNLSQFRSSQIHFEKENNLALAKEIDAKGWEKGISTVLLDADKIRLYHLSSELDHGAIVPIYFVEKAYKSYQLIHINYGLLSRLQLYRFGHLMASCIEESDQKVAVIASGDLSHKLTKDAPAGYHPDGKVFDEKLLAFLEKGKVQDILSIDEKLSNEAGECGLRSIDIMLGIFEGYDINVDILSYEGPFGVGYGTAVINPVRKNNDRLFIKKIMNAYKEKMENIRKKEDQYVKIARQSLENYVLYKERIRLPEEANNDLFAQKGGAFVSIKKDGELRGCIGTTEATESSIGEEIIKNAIHAGTQDPRFYPVEKNELSDLIYSVDILGEMEAIDSKDRLDPQNYGVVVEHGHKRGLLLPNLEGVNTVQQQIGIALEKSGIKKGEKYKMYRFKVERHK